MSRLNGDDYDAIIIGSGAGGGMAAYRLTKAGAKVLILEAGRDYDPASETPMFNLNSEAPLRGAGTPDKEFGFYDATAEGGWDIPGEPYTTGNGNFRWWRSRMVGGRTNHWARNSFRMGPYDFKPKSRDGLGMDWPVSYDEIAPWYDKTEELIGVYGVNSGLENHPDSGPGVLHEPPAPRVYELLVKAGCDDLGIPCVPARRAILTRPLDNRSPCFYATPCGRGCSIGAAFQTTTSLLPMANETGNLMVQPNAMVREITVGDDGKANGIIFIDRESGEERSVSARIVVLAASACESSRILLNSKSSLFPNGLANSSGQVGRNLMDTVGTSIGAQIPGLMGRPAYNEDGAMGLHMYMPWWLYREQARGELDFPRGYHIEFGGGFGQPGSGGASWGNGYGKSYKEDVRQNYGSTVWFACRGEMIPNDDCYAEIDPNVTDKYGIPVLRFNWKWSEHELRMVTHFHKAMRELISRLGGRVDAPIPDPNDAISDGGVIIHEVGTTRMGDKADNSVTNSYGQAWDVPNLFIMDGGVFTSKAHKNPTLTILALAWRNSDYLAGLMNAGDL